MSHQLKLIQLVQKKKKKKKKKNKGKKKKKKKKKTNGKTNIMKSQWLEDAPHFSFNEIHSFFVVASFKDCIHCSIVY